MKYFVYTERDISEELKEILDSKSWTSFNCKIKLSITGNRNNNWQVSGNFSFLDMLIIGKNIKILRYLIDTQMETVASESRKVIKIESSKSDEQFSQDMWIYGATSIHLAAKFMPQGLELLLSNLENLEVLETKNDFGHTPLHVAARNNDSLCIRYYFSTLSAHHSVLE